MMKSNCIMANSDSASDSFKSFLFVSYSAFSSSCPVRRLLIRVPPSIHLTQVAAVTRFALMASTALLLLALSSFISLTGKRHSDA